MTAPSPFFESTATATAIAPAPASTTDGAEHRDGLTFARRVMEGWPVCVDRFLSEYRPAVLRYLVKLSWDARSREEAESAVDDVFSECFGGFSQSGRQRRKRVPLLKRYKGHGSLEGWLKRIARNRFYSALRRSEYRQRATGVEPEAEWLGAASTDPRKAGAQLTGDLSCQPFRNVMPDDERERVRDAIRGAFASLADHDSQALIFLRLHFLEKIKKQRIAEAWQQHPATIGRRITAGLDHLRTEITNRLPDYGSGSQSNTFETLIVQCRDLLDAELA